MHFRSNLVSSEIPCWRRFGHSVVGVFFLVLIVFASSTEAQVRNRPVGRSAGSQPVEKKTGKTVKQFVADLPWESVGPANMGGRIVAISVFQKNPTTWWAATASGGLLKTVNNGVTFQHQFDNQSTVSVGDVKVFQGDSNIVWVGTGEANPRNSVSWGNGVYKSMDGGKTWKHMGLKNGFQTGRIALHPTDSKIAYVGVLGRLWGPSKERGVFKTVDGGKTWKKVLFINDKTGVIDVQMHPKNPEVLIAAAYERMRDGFDGNDPAVKFGKKAGIYRSEDGGESWDRVTEGLPTCKIGRIGLDWSVSNPDHVYAIVESEKIGSGTLNQAYMGVQGANVEVGAKLTTVVKGGPAEKAGLKANDIVVRFGKETVVTYQGLTSRIGKQKAGEKVTVHYVRGGKPGKVELTLGKRPNRNAGRGNRRNAGRAFSASLGGQRENVQDQQGKEGYQYGGLYMSSDQGVTWKRINSINPRPMYYSQVRVDPTNEKYIYVLGTSLYRSSDGGKTFRGDGGRGIHPDNHALWIDPRDSKHMILGNDGGLYATFDRMNNWDHHNHVAIGQFYHVGIDTRRNYNIYGGLQDNGSWGGPRRNGTGGVINTDWFRIGGGDGFICLVDPEDPNQLYSESQNGAMGSMNLKTGDRGFIRPRAPRGTRYRFNWKTPFILSAHNSKIHYSVGNYVFQSIYKGRRPKAISPEITNTNRGAGSAVSESPLQEGLIYAGTTDGAIWVSREEGKWSPSYSVKEKKVKGSSKKDDADKAAADEEKGAEVKSEKKVEKKETPKSKQEARPSRSSSPRRSGFLGRDAGSRSGQRGALRIRTGKLLKDLVPGPRWVSSLHASKFRVNRCYVSLDGHRSNDDKPYLFVTEDFGKTWFSVRGNLPAEAGSVRVLREDLFDENILYAGCEFSAWVSLDRGKTWNRFGGLPTVAVHEMAQHPKTGEVIAGTHGRSVWVADVTPVRQLAGKKLAEDVVLGKPNDVVRWKRRPSRGSSGTRRFVSQPPVAVARIVYSLPKAVDSAVLKIIDINDSILYRADVAKEQGVHFVSWNLRRNSSNPQSRRRRFTPIGLGKYRAVLEVDGKEFKQVFEILDDPSGLN